MPMVDLAELGVGRWVQRDTDNVSILSEEDLVVVHE